MAIFFYIDIALFLSSDMIESSSEKAKVKLNASVSTDEIDAAYSIKGDLEASYGDAWAFSGDLSLTKGTCQNDQLEGTKEEGGFVINGRYDVKYIENNFNPMISMLLGSLGNSFNGESENSNDCNEDGADLSYDSSFDSSHDSSN